MTYLAITLPAVILAAVLGFLFKRRIGTGALMATLLVMLLLTAIFDNLIIASGLVAYDASQIHGAKVGLAPIEDFAYSIFGVVFVPLVWMLLERKK